MRLSFRQTIEVEFKISDANFQEVTRMLGIILQKDMTEHDQGYANETGGREIRFRK